MLLLLYSSKNHQLSTQQELTLLHCAGAAGYVPGTEAHRKKEVRNLVQLLQVLFAMPACSFFCIEYCVAERSLQCAGRQVWQHRDWQRHRRQVWQHWHGHRTQRLQR